MYFHIEFPVKLDIKEHPKEGYEDSEGCGRDALGRVAEITWFVHPGGDEQGPHGDFQHPHEGKQRNRVRSGT